MYFTFYYNCHNFILWNCHYFIIFSLYYSVLRKVIVFKIVWLVPRVCIVFARRASLMRFLGALVTEWTSLLLVNREETRSRTQGTAYTYALAVLVGRACTRWGIYTRDIPYEREREDDKNREDNTMSSVCASGHTSPPRQPSWRTPLDCQLKKSQEEKSLYAWHNPHSLSLSLSNAGRIEKEEKRRKGRINGLWSVTRTRAVLRTSSKRAREMRKALWRRRRDGSEKAKRETERKEFQGEKGLRWC